MGDGLDSISREEHGPLSVGDSAEILAELRKVVRRTRDFLSANWLVPLLFAAVLLLTEPLKHAFNSSVASVVDCHVDTINPPCGPTSSSGVHTITSINFGLPTSANPLSWLGSHIWFWVLTLTVTFVAVGVIWILRVRSSARIRILPQAAIAAISGTGAAILIDLVFGLPVAGYLMGLAFSICVWAAVQGSVDMMAVGGIFLTLAGPSTKLPPILHSFDGLRISLQTEIHALWGIFLLVTSMAIFLRTHSHSFTFLRRLGHELFGKAGKSFPR